MNRTFAPVLAVVLASFASAPLRAQEGATDMAMPAPGPEHEILKQRAGTWTFVNKMYMAPGQPPSESTGTETVTMGCGGFWQFSRIESTMMGMPFDGRGSLGYDQIKKKYVGTWVDNFGSWLTLMEGDYDAKTKTLTMLSDMLDMSGKVQKTKMVTEHKDADHITFKMIMIGAGEGGKDHLTMEIAYTRKK